jgi:hypothetical protein
MVIAITDAYRYCQDIRKEYNKLKAIDFAQKVDHPIKRIYRFILEHYDMEKRLLEEKKCEISELRRKRDWNPAQEEVEGILNKVLDEFYEKISPEKYVGFMVAMDQKLEDAKIRKDENAVLEIQALMNYVRENNVENIEDCKLFYRLEERAAVTPKETFRN